MKTLKEEPFGRPRRRWGGLY